MRFLHASVRPACNFSYRRLPAGFSLGASTDQNPGRAMLSNGDTSRIGINGKKIEWSFHAAVFGLSPIPKRWDENVAINCEAGGGS